MSRLQSAYATQGPKEIRPYWSTFVSFDHPALQSLDTSRKSPINGQYSLADASQSDIAEVRQWVKETTKSAKPNNSVDWSLVVERIVAHFGPVLWELQMILSLHDNQQRSRYQRLLNDLSMTAANTEDQSSKCSLFFMPIAQKEDVARTYSAHMVLYDSVFHVLQQLCALGPHLQDLSLTDLSQARNRVDALIAWLDWPTAYRCARVCQGPVSLSACHLGTCLTSSGKGILYDFFYARKRNSYVLELRRSTSENQVGSWLSSGLHRA